jgi:hypothetical protein
LATIDATVLRELASKKTWRTGSDASYPFASQSNKIAFSESGNQVERSATTALAGAIERP